MTETTLHALPEGCEHLAYAMENATAPFAPLFERLIEQIATVDDTLARGDGLRERAGDPHGDPYARAALEDERDALVAEATALAVDSAISESTAITMIALLQGITAGTRP